MLIIEKVESVESSVRGDFSVVVPQQMAKHVASSGETCRSVQSLLIHSIEMNVQRLCRMPVMRHR